MAQRGRPSKYTEELQKAALKYINGGYKTAEDSLVPSAVGLARYLNVSESRLYVWADTYPEFKETLDDCKAQQHLMLVSHGLTGKYNSNIVKLMLSNHGYSDRVQQDNISSDGSMSLIERLNRGRDRLKGDD